MKCIVSFHLAKYISSSERRAEIGVVDGRCENFSFQLWSCMEGTWSKEKLRKKNYFFPFYVETCALVDRKIHNRKIQFHSKSWRVETQLTLGCSSICLQILNSKFFLLSLAVLDDLHRMSSGKFRSNDKKIYNFFICIIALSHNYTRTSRYYELPSDNENTYKINELFCWHYQDSEHRYAVKKLTNPRDEFLYRKIWMDEGRKKSLFSLKQ